MAVNNPPFPYTCKIIHYGEVNPFTGVAVSEVLYEGHCDIEGNKYPTMKEGVLVNKIKIYIDDINSPSRIYNIGDAIEVNRFGKVEEFILNDYFPTNFGTTIQCDIVMN